MDHYDGHVNYKYGQDIPIKDNAFARAKSTLAKKSAHQVKRRLV